MIIPKYRAYIKATGEIHQVSAIDFEGQVLWIPKSHSETHLKCLRLDEIELMQYIGREDINKKEVYDRDIIKIRDNDLNGNCAGYLIGQIRWIKADGAFKVDITGEAHFWHIDCCEWSEILGNIHQNPELLEVTT